MSFLKVGSLKATVCLRGLVNFQQALSAKSSKHLSLVILSTGMPFCYDLSRPLLFYKDIQGTELNAAILHLAYHRKMG
jgi:hypothetical protein